MKTTDQDPWKSMIDNQRAAFDSEEPRDLWSNIEQELDAERAPVIRSIRLSTVYRIAALFILVVGFAFIAMYLHLSDQPQLADRSDVKPSEELQWMAYSEELMEVESYYTAEIDRKMVEVTELTDDQEVVNEINLLSSEFEELKSEMGDQVNDEKVLEAMIQNYKLRLDLLEEILSELKLEEDLTTKNDDTEEI